jgi:ketosteroid isomerase-like protein
MGTAAADLMRRLYADYDLTTGVPKLWKSPHPEIEIVVAAGWMDMETTFHGKEGVREYFTGLQEVSETCVRARGARGPRRCARRGHRGAREGRESGAATSVPVFQVLWFEDGLLRRVHGFTDRAAALAAVNGGD